MTEVGWLELALQAGPAVSMAALFLWYLVRKSAGDDQARAEFLSHLQAKDEQHMAAVAEQMKYLRERDAQSKEIASSGHSALREHTQALHLLREEMRERIRELQE